MAGWISRADHPVLQGQQAAQSGAQVNPQAFISELGDSIDATPATLAAFVLGAAATLFMLKAAGFRFNFGVGARWEDKVKASTRYLILGLVLGALALHMYNSRRA